MIYYFRQLNIYQAGFPERGECSVIGLWKKRNVIRWIEDSDYCPTIIFQGEMDKALKSMVESKKLATLTCGEYVAIAENEECLPNLELFLDALEVLKDAIEVEERISFGFSPLSVEEMQEIMDGLVEEEQFALVEGPLSNVMREWIEENGFVLKSTRNLVAIAKHPEFLPELNLMYALYAAELDIQIENWAIVRKE